MVNTLHEECGVFGIYEKERSDVASSVYFGLYALQHRGQESCGITVSDDGVFRHKRADGLVSEVFTKEELAVVLKELTYMKEHPEEYKSYNNVNKLFEALDND